MKKLMIFFIIIIIALVVSALPNNNQVKNKIPSQRQLQISRMLIEESGDSKTDYPLERPSSIARDSKGNIYLFDSPNYTIVKYDQTGKYTLHWGKKGKGPGELSQGFNMPLYIDHSDNIYIPNHNNSSINIFSSDGKLIKCFRTKKPACSIAVDKKGSIYLTLMNSQKTDKLIYIYSPDGNKIAEFGEPYYIKDESPFFNNSSIAFDDEGFLYQVFTSFPVLRKYNSTGQLIFEKKIIFPKGIVFNEWNEIDRDHPFMRDNDAYVVFSNKILCSKKSIFIDGGNLIQTDKEGNVKGIYLIPRMPPKGLFPGDAILYPDSKEILRVVRGENMNGAAFYKIDSLE